MIERCKKKGGEGGGAGSAPLSASMHRRESRCSRDLGTPAFGAVQQEVPRLAPPLTGSLHRPSVQIFI